jgi:hypothetical protein
MALTERAKQFRADYEAADQAWYTTSGDSTPNTVWVQGEARTGSKYEVLISKLPEIPSSGKYLVSVMQPWQTCYPIADLWELAPEYVLERFKNPVRERSEVHGGDVAGVTRAINYAISKYEEWTAMAVREEAAQ